MKQIIASVIIMIGLVTLAGVGYLALERFSELKEKQLANEARFQCAQSSRYQIQDGVATVWYPVEELYLKCLKEKDY